MFDFWICLIADSVCSFFWMNIGTKCVLVTSGNCKKEMNHLAIVQDHLSIWSIQYTMNRDELIYGCFIRFFGILVPTSSHKGCTIWLYGSLLATLLVIVTAVPKSSNPINTNKTSIENNRDFGENSLLGKRGNSLALVDSLGSFAP